MEPPDELPLEELLDELPLDELDELLPEEEPLPEEELPLDEEVLPELLPDEEVLPDDEPLEELLEELLEEPLEEPLLLPEGVAHVPWIEPGGARHGSPSQQSALVVHDWPLFSQIEALHWSAPVGPGTHGLPPQHSEADAHAVPAAMQPMPPSPLTPV